jgi:hypothetical protein
VNEAVSIQDDCLSVPISTVTGKWMQARPSPPLLPDFWKTKLKEEMYHILISEFKIIFKCGTIFVPISSSLAIWAF